jgi:hypothetical protein
LDLNFRRDLPLEALPGVARTFDERHGLATASSSWDRKTMFQAAGESDADQDFSSASAGSKMVRPS